jgi:ribosomal protein L19
MLAVWGRRAPGIVARVMGPISPVSRSVAATAGNGIGSARRFSMSSAGGGSMGSIGSQSARNKHKVPQKRASSLLHLLRNEEFDKLKKGRNWPDIRAGDSVEITKLAYASSAKPETIKGLVIAKVNRASDTAITLINNEFGTPVVRRLLLYGPTIVDVKLLQKAYIHEGKKRVRRSKIYYYMDKDPKLFTIT